MGRTMGFLLLSSTQFCPQIFSLGALLAKLGNRGLPMSNVFFKKPNPTAPHFGLVTFPVNSQGLLECIVHRFLDLKVWLPATTSLVLMPADLCLSQDIGHLLSASPLGGWHHPGNFPRPLWSTALGPRRSLFKLTSAFPINLPVSCF